MTLSDLWPTFQGHDNIQRQITRVIVSRVWSIQWFRFQCPRSDPLPRFQGHGVIRPIDTLDVLCAQLTRDLFAIAKFLLVVPQNGGVYNSLPRWLTRGTLVSPELISLRYRCEKFVSASYTRSKYCDHAVRPSVCLTIRKIAQKRGDNRVDHTGRHWQWATLRSEVVKFGCWSDCGCGSGITSHFP